MQFEKISDENRAQVNRFLRERWFSTEMVAHGECIDMTRLPGFFVRNGEKIAGLVTFRISGGDCEVVSLDSVKEGRGVGSALLECAVRAAEEGGCRRVFLITTNDNLNALRFYQKRGFCLSKLYRNALDASRKLKPSIPPVGDDGIPLRDEIELERVLGKPRQGGRKEA